MPARILEVEMTETKETDVQMRDLTVEELESIRGGDLWGVAVLVSAFAAGALAMPELIAIAAVCGAVMIFMP
jgi:hypothetical protein